MTEIPTPSQAMVDAARNHLTGRFAKGLDEMMWDFDRYPMADLDAIRAVLAVLVEAPATGPDLAAALILVQAARLTVDRLEADVTEAARAAGLTWQQVADVLGLPDEDDAGQRYEQMLRRRAEPNRERPGRPGGQASTSQQTPAGEPAP